MKDEAESFVNDIEVYSKGLILAIQGNKFKEAIDYTNKIKELLERVKTYAEMKKRV
jgi:predicted translin family RNA/ssDNA-binding protein